MELSFCMEMSAGANDDVIIVIIIIGWLPSTSSGSLRLLVCWDCSIRNTGNHMRASESLEGIVPSQFYP